MYPAGAAKDNGADIFRAAVGMADNASVWRVDWNTLVDAKVPVAAWTFDTDGNAKTGGSRWPAQANISSAGIERALVVTSRGAQLVDTVNGKTLATFRTAVDMAARSFLVHVPRSALPVSGTWRVRLAAGLADASGRAFAVPILNGGGAAAGSAPRVYNMGFRSVAQEPALYAAASTAPVVNALGQVAQTPVVGPKGTAAAHNLLASNFWGEAAQADVLSRGDVSAFSAAVDWKRLEERRTTASPLVRGWSNRWYATDLNLGQGVDAANGSTSFVGRVQPYAVYVPRGYEPGQATPLTLFLHSASSNYNQYAAVNPRLTRELCEERSSICLTPEAFGSGGLYVGIAEHDTWQVWRQAALAYVLDPDRTVVTGYSMGGLASFVMPANYPEVFAATMPLDGGFDDACSTAGAAANFSILSAADRSANTHWMPAVVSDSYTDELSPYPNNAELARRLSAAGNRFSLFSTTTPEHITTDAADGFTAQVAALGTPRRTVRPATVDYTWCANVLDPKLGLVPTSVYWLSGLAQRDHAAPSTTSRVVATSAALAADQVTSQLDTSVVAAEDGPPMHVLTNRWNAGDRLPMRKTATLTLTNVKALTLDVSAAALPTGQARVESDGPVLLTLSHLQPGTVVRIGDMSLRVGASGRVGLRLQTGASKVAWTRS
ncbi:MAG: hypothetical protein JJD92_12460 [Frankiaceae bacterium]|nr:hypothetical protein [Frankiaceae bacterium]